MLFTNACDACGNVYLDESLPEWGGMFAEGFTIESSVRSQSIAGNRPLTVNAHLGESIPDLLADEGVRNRFKRDVRTEDLSALRWRKRRF